MARVIQWLRAFATSPIDMTRLFFWTRNTYFLQIGEREYRLVPVSHIVLTENDFKKVDQGKV